RQRRLHRAIWRACLDGENLVDFVEGRILDRLVRKDAGVVHENVEATEASDDRLYCPHRAVVVPMVGLDSTSLSAFVRKLRDQPFGRFGGREISDGHRGATRCQRAGNGGAHASAPSGDESDLVLEFFHRLGHFYTDRYISLSACALGSS